jgi:hypothetical protein
MDKDFNTSGRISFIWHEFRKPVDHWLDRMDDVQVELLVQDMMFDSEDTLLAREMLGGIGIACS